MEHYYNTTSLNLAELIKEDLTAQNQEVYILKIFELVDDKFFTPFEIQKICIENGKQIEITSVRRAITNLEKQGKLMKSAKASFMGNFGKVNYGWKFNNGRIL